MTNEFRPTDQLTSMVNEFKTSNSTQNYFRYILNKTASYRNILIQNQKRNYLSKKWIENPSMMKIQLPYPSLCKHG